MDVTVVESKLLVDFITAVRSTGHSTVVTELEALAARIMQDSQGLPFGFLRLHKDHLLVSFSTFYSLGHSAGIRLLFTFAHCVGMVLEEDDLAGLQDFTDGLQVRTLPVLSGTTPAPDKVNRLYQYLLIRSRAINRGDLRQFCESLSPLQALAHYIHLYGLLRWSAIKGDIGLDTLCPPHQVKRQLHACLSR